MVELVLHSAEGPFVAFNLDFDLWFIQLEPIPRIFDADLKPQVLANFDSWFQAKTHQRYSFQNFKDIACAFRLGLAKSYSLQQLHDLAGRTVIASKMALMERMGEYGKHFWIEILDPVKLETVWVAKIREKFDVLRAKLGDDEFYNYLCRLWKFASKHRPGLTIVFERFIKRLGKEPMEPKFPQTDELDHELCKAVLITVFDHNMSVYCGVPKHVQERLALLNGRS